MTKNKILRHVEERSILRRKVVILWKSGTGVLDWDMSAESLIDLKTWSYTIRHLSRHPWSPNYTNKKRTSLTSPSITLLSSHGPYILSTIRSTTSQQLDAPHNSSLRGSSLNAAKYRDRASTFAKPGRWKWVKVMYFVPNS